MITVTRCCPLFSSSVQEKAMRSPLRLFITFVLLSVCIQALDVASWSPCDWSTETVSSVSTLYAQEQTSRTQATEKQSAKNVAEDTWQVIFIGEQKIGYARDQTRKMTVDGKTVIRSTGETHMTMMRFGQTLRMETIFTTDETETGRMLSFEFELRNPPAAPSKTVGRIADKNDGTGLQQLLLETTVAGSVKKSRLDWDPEIKTPAYQDRLFHKSPLKPGDKRKFKTFAPQLNKVTLVNLSADRLRKTKLFDGNRRDLLKVRITQSILPTMQTYAYLDDKGSLLKTETDYLRGQSMITYTVSKDEALKAIEGEELDLAVDSLVRVKPIRNAHRTNRAVYRVTTPGEDPSEFLVADSTQQVKKIDTETAEVTVIVATLPKGRKKVVTERKYSQPTTFLQSNDGRVQEMARRASAGETHPSRIAGRMEQYVNRKLTNKNFSTALASAAEVAKNLEGDCTEHAVLLAAMLRAEKIPSRIAVGMVYVHRHSAFGGHMWTEAWLDGRWIPLDATLGQQGIGAGHIKLAVSGFEDDGPAPISSFIPLMQILGDMKIEVVEIE
jgi:transglutaminase-like putative cysteine protease